MRNLEPETVTRAQAELESAFAEVGGVSRAALSEMTAHSELEQLRRTFGDRRWQELTLSELVEQRDSLPLLSPIAFHAYLPAFLVACLLEPTPVLDVLWDNVISSLTLRSEPEAQWAEKLKHFSPAQLEAIEHCLELIAAEERADWPTMPQDADRAGLAVERWRRMRTSE